MKLSKTETAFLKALQSDDCLIFRNGWPDFLIFEDGEYKFIEVKNEDKLRDEQIAIMEILNKLGLKCYIWCPERGLIKFKDYKPLKKKKLRLIKPKLKQEVSKEDWLDLKIKMALNEVTFQSIANLFNLSRQRVHEIIKKGHTAKGSRAKQVLNEFYGRLSG